MDKQRIIAAFTLFTFLILAAAASVLGQDTQIQEVANQPSAYDSQKYSLTDATTWDSDFWKKTDFNSMNQEDLNKFISAYTGNTVNFVKENAGRDFSITNDASGLRIVNNGVTISLDNFKQPDTNIKTTANGFCINDKCFGNVKTISYDSDKKEFNVASKDNNFKIDGAGDWQGDIEEKDGRIIVTASNSPVKLRGDDGAQFYVAEGGSAEISYKNKKLDYLNIKPGTKEQSVVYLPNAMFSGRKMLLITNNAPIEVSKSESSFKGDNSRIILDNNGIISKMGLKDMNIAFFYTDEKYFSPKDSVQRDTPYDALGDWASLNTQDLKDAANSRRFGLFSIDPQNAENPSTISRRSDDIVRFYLGFFKNAINRGYGTCTVGAVRGSFFPFIAGGYILIIISMFFVISKIAKVSSRHLLTVALLLLLMPAVISEGSSSTEDRICNTYSTNNQLQGDSAKQQTYLDGISMYSQGKYDEALKKFEEALKDDPGNNKIINAIENTRSKLSFSTGVVERGVMDPETKTRYNNGITAYSNGDYAVALRNFEEALKKSPNDPRIQKNIERTRLKIKNTKNQNGQ